MITVPEVVPDRATDLVKYWSEWQDWALRSIVIEFTHFFQAYHSARNAVVDGHSISPHVRQSHRGLPGPAIRFGVWRRLRAKSHGR
jgi:hypothetical protein